MQITWKIEMRKVANDNESLERSMEFEADTIGRGKI